jgi:hypothetical protein
VKSLFNPNKMMERFFRPVDGMCWDLMSGRVGMRSPEGITTVSGEGADARVETNMVDDFGVDVPAFAQSTPVDQVKLGDLIVSNALTGWVIEKQDGGVFKLLQADGTRTEWAPPKQHMMGMDITNGGVMVLRSLMNMFPSGEGESGGMAGIQNMIMPMMLMGGDMDLDRIMPMVLMSQMGNTIPSTDGDGTAANPFAAMGGNMMQTMMMMQMFSGGGSAGGPGFFGRGGRNYFDQQEDRH